MNIAPYGTWDSPLSATKVCSAAISFQDLVLDNQTVYWSEMRPNEGGRYVIVKKAMNQSSQNQSAQDVLPVGFSARTRVHEYGGAAFTVKNNVIYFINDLDQRLYQIQEGDLPKPITASGMRFAECQMSRFGIIAVGEEHHSNRSPDNFLALLKPTGEIVKLIFGDDFYAFPSLTQDQQKIAWISWDHPNMPWDNTKLWVADIDENGLSNIKQIDASTKEQSFFQPQWNSDNTLYVMSDKSNWWNLYWVKDQQLESVFSVSSDLAQPLWALGRSTWGFFNGGILCSYPNLQDKISRLGVYHDNQFTQLNLPYQSFSQIRVSEDKFVCIAGAPDKPSAIIYGDSTTFSILKENVALTIDSGYLSNPKHITFPSENNRVAHAYYYAPSNIDYQAPLESKPPLIVKSHGGPTGNCGCDLNLEIQYWTSRGYAFLDVNYGGSTGYGRAYRNLLKGNWGIVDVQDCVAGALYLSQQGLVDSNKLAITGGSAGGYTTLAALTFTNTFQVGASLYGVSDCEALALDTHKFESRYLDGLIGPYPQDIATYRARSPIYHVDKLSSPVIFFQGTEDKVVPPSQTEKMYQALKEKGIETALFLFEGEQHGFRKAENRVIVLEEENKFFRKVLLLK